MILLCFPIRLLYSLRICLLYGLFCNFRSFLYSFFIGFLLFLCNSNRSFIFLILNFLIPFLAIRLVRISINNFQSNYLFRSSLLIGSNISLLI
jgi:hypothetical protein